MQSSNSMAVRPLVRVLAGATFLAIALFGFIAPVTAKGPESATITGPGIDRPIELMDAADFDLVARLMEQTGLWYGTGDLPRRLEEPPGKLGPAYTLTWINSGPPAKSREERTIRQVIYLDAEDGPVIHTPAQEALQGSGPGVTGWFAAPSGLRDTLAQLGMPLSAASPFSNAAGAFWYLGVLGFALVVGLAGALGARRTIR